MQLFAVLRPEHETVCEPGDQPSQPDLHGGRAHAGEHGEPAEYGQSDAMAAGDRFLLRLEDLSAFRTRNGFRP